MNIARMYRRSLHHSRLKLDDTVTIDEDIYIDSNNNKSLKGCVGTIREISRCYNCRDGMCTAYPRNGYRCIANGTKYMAHFRSQWGFSGVLLCMHKFTINGIPIEFDHY